MWDSDWSRCKRVRINSLRPGDRFISALGEAWTYEGLDETDSLGMHRAVPAEAGKRSPRGWSRTVFASSAEVALI